MKKATTTIIKPSGRTHEQLHCELLQYDEALFLIMDLSRSDKFNVYLQRDHRSNNHTIKIISSVGNKEPFYIDIPINCNVLKIDANCSIIFNESITVQDLIDITAKNITFKKGINYPGKINVLARNIGNISDNCYLFVSATHNSMEYSGNYVPSLCKTNVI